MQQYESPELDSLIRQEAGALLKAIEAEPVPQVIVDLARRLQARLNAFAEGQVQPSESPER